MGQSTRAAVGRRSSATERCHLRYRDPATGKLVRRTFTDSDAAEAFRAAIRAARLEGVRWPLEPLLAPSGLDRWAFAQRYRIRYPSIDQAATDGLTDQQADQWATRAGYHPVSIWGWAWIDAGLTAGQIDHPDERPQAVA